MREIKFRCWSVKKKTMYHLSESLGSDTSLQLNNHSWGVFEECESICTCNKSFKDVLMQYTGLKDKNGKEIYEGDIVMDCINYSKYKVMYVVENWTGYVAETLDEAECWYLYEFSELEVIGNIYENPELLQ